MNKIFASLALLSATVVFTLGCGGASSEGPELSIPAVMSTAYESATLCGKCGQMKGTEACCAEGAETCAGCSLHKGAPGCCKIEAGTDATLCAGCGQVKGSESCCAEGAETCAACGLHQGAPGCCKLKKLASKEDSDDDEGSGNHGEES